MAFSQASQVGRRLTRGNFFLIVQASGATPRPFPRTKFCCTSCKLNRHRCCMTALTPIFPSRTPLLGFAVLKSFTGVSTVPKPLSLKTNSSIITAISLARDAMETVPEFFIFLFPFWLPLRLIMQQSHPRRLHPASCHSLVSAMLTL